MWRVLLIEDEAVLRTSLVRGLQKLADVEVAGAGDLGSALSALDRTPPDLVISDIDLPDRSGLELLGELGRRRLDVPVIYVTAYLKAYRSQIPPHAKIDVLEKPVALEDLRSLVQRRLHTATEDTAPFGAADYVQLACLGHHSVIVEIHGPDVAGDIVIVGGEPWSARDGAGTGREAFARLVFAMNAVVTCRALRGETRARDVFEPCEALLMDAARVIDEASRDLPTPATKLADHDQQMTASATPTEAPAGPAFEAAWDRALDALLGKDYQTALQAFLEARAHRPDDARVAVNLKRLAELGYSAKGGTS